MFLKIDVLYLIAAIGVIVGLITLFFITYVMNKKTPVPKGCEQIEISNENCSACNNTTCSIKEKIDFEKIQEELKEEE